MNEFRESTYNMAGLMLQRIHDEQQAHHQYKRLEFYKGNPLYKDILNIQENIYTEIRAKLIPKQKEVGDAYRFILRKKYPIRVEGDMTIVPKITIAVMEEQMDWLGEMMFIHKIMMATSDDPGDVIE